MRQVVLDTETTGLDPAEGHRVIEIGCIELIDRHPTGRHFHRYLNPEREVDAGALEVHGLDDEFLASQPRFAEIATEFLDFVRDSELLIHNAEFDVGFLDAELARLDPPVRIADYATVYDTLALARELHPGQRNTLDALCKRYQVDASGRTLHGALLDAELLMQVYLAMTGGQVDLALKLDAPAGTGAHGAPARVDPSRLVRRPPTAAELAEHEALIAKIDDAAGERGALWRQLNDRH
ncbi:MAG: DNA polymerase III subunit epsilon [Wenzhouxiangellaceae bacterium]